MRKVLVPVVAIATVALLATPAAARVINVEFKFTPFTGDPAKADLVTSVPGEARVFVNNIPVTEEAVEKRELPVLFEEREIAPSVWLPVESLGSLLKKGANTIRIEFEPTDRKAKYSAQLRWASVTDQTTTTGDASSGSSTNQTGEGVETKAGAGKLVFERSFQADFTADQKWHHYPAITALSDADKRDLQALVVKRSDLFKPDFAGVYALLGGNAQVNAAEMKKAKCIEKAHEAGVRVSAAKPDQIDFVTTGGPAVVVQGRKGKLFEPANPSAIEKIKGDEMQMCAGMALYVAYPPRLVVVRSPEGSWQVLP